MYFRTTSWFISRLTRRFALGSVMTDREAALVSNVISILITASLSFSANNLSSPAGKRKAGTYRLAWRMPCYGSCTSRKAARSAGCTGEENRKGRMMIYIREASIVEGWCTIHPHHGLRWWNLLALRLRVNVWRTTYNLLSSRLLFLSCLLTFFFRCSTPKRSIDTI